MEPHELAIAAKYIGAGLAAIGTGAAGIGPQSSISKTRSEILCAPGSPR